MDDSVRAFGIDEGATVDALRQQIIDRLELKESNCFAVFEARDNWERCLNEDEVPGQIMTEWEKEKAEGKFIFKKKIFLRDDEREMDDPVAKNLLYIQARKSVIDSEYPVNADDAVRLAGVPLYLFRRTPDAADLWRPQSYNPYVWLLNKEREESSASCPVQLEESGRMGRSDPERAPQTRWQERRRGNYRVPGDRETVSFLRHHLLPAMQECREQETTQQSCYRSQRRGLNPSEGPRQGEDFVSSLHRNLLLGVVILHFRL
jgi:hypothetical protein